MQTFRIKETIIHKKESILQLSNSINNYTLITTSPQDLNPILQTQYLKPAEDSLTKLRPARHKNMYNVHYHIILRILKHKGIMVTLSDLTRSSGLTVQVIATQSNMSEKNLNGYISGKKDINNMPLKDAIRLSSALGITVETLSQLDLPNISHELNSLDTNTRFSNFIACTNEYRIITCKKDDSASEDEDPTQQSSYRLRLPKNTTIGNYYLKASFLRKYFTDDDVSIYRIVDSFKKKLSDLGITEYDDDIKDIEEKLQRLKVTAKYSTTISITPTALFSRILYSTALHGDANKRQALRNLNLPEDLLHFALIYEVGLRENILQETYANLLDAHTKGFLDFDLPKNMLDEEII